MQQKDLNEVKKYIKELSKKLRKEGSTTAGVGAYATPKAFVGDSDAEGSKKGLDASTAYTVKPPKKKRFFIGYKDQGKHLSDIKEANYKQFKEDTSVPQHKKINQAILEINRRISEINREVVRTIYGTAKLGAQVGTTTRGTFDLDTDSNGRWMVEKVKGLAFQIEREANTIAKTTRRGKGNVMICSSDVASASTITITAPITFVSGGVAVQNINPPSSILTTSGQIVNLKDY